MAAVETADPDRDDAPAVIERVGLGSLALRAVAVSLALTTNIALAGLLGARQFGLYGLGTSFGLVVALMIGRSAGTLQLRLVGAHGGKEEWGLVRGAMIASRRFGLISAAVASLVIAGVAMVAYDGATTILLSIALIPILSRALLAQSLLRGMHRFWAALVPELVLRNGCLLVLVLGYVLVFGKASMNGNVAMGLTIGAAAIELAVASVLARRATPTDVRLAPPQVRTREWAVILVPLLLAQALTMTEQNSSLWLLGQLRSAAEVGLFAGARRYADIVAAIVVSFGFALAPFVAKAHAQGAAARVEAAAVRAASLMLTVAVPLIVIVSILRVPLLALMGKEFSVAGSCLLVLLAGQVVNAACGATIVCLTMMGQERAVVVALAVATVASVVLSALLIPLWGIVGAAVAQAVSTAMWNIGLAAFAWRRCGVHVTALGRLRARRSA